MLQLTRFARYEPSINPEHQSKRSQLMITNNASQQQSTLELRDIIHQKHADDKETIVTKWILFSGDERDCFEVKVGVVNIVDEHLAFMVQSINYRNEAVINFYASDDVVLLRADAKMGDPS